MKKGIQVLSVVGAFILLVIGIFTAVFGEGTAVIPAIMLILSVGLLLLSAFIAKRPQAFGKMWRIVCIVLAGIFALISVLSMSFSFNTKGTPIADIDKKVEIWGKNIPGNSTKSKLDDMNINKNARTLGATLNFIGAIVGEEYKDVEKELDTFSYIHGIKVGYEKETYEDTPFLIPYIVEHSDSAVIVVPGGGYGYKSIEGGNGEGKDVALALNQKGISAFVLWYRSNPYQFPIPQLDLQRAVRYIRYNAETYGIDPQKISLIGYSAGGYQIGSFINQYRGVDAFPDGYIKDDIDKTDDNVNAAAMIYPALTFRYNVPMLFCAFNDDDVRSETKRKELLNETDLALNFNSKDIKQLVCYGTKDGMVGMNGAKAYIRAAKIVNTDITELSAKDQDHGFAQKYYMESFLKLIV